ncbi:helix-turn-helix transcriptional regulator, partial [Streptomyces bottropensis]|uniref:helix-turn-helix transcriptional regulator n=1 Tax=Streptomyces bottropensis TaxID=42235 RepID=UPI00368746C7
MRAARLIRMALLVQSSPGLTAVALARELDVPKPTVIRDAQALQEAGVPIRSERGSHLALGHRTRLTTLHPTEAETLYLSGLPGRHRLRLTGAAAIDRARAEKHYGGGLRRHRRQILRRLVTIHSLLVNWPPMSCQSGLSGHHFPSICHALWSI